MTKNLFSLALGALNEYESLLQLREWMEMTLEQLDDSGDKSRTRACMLIEAYQSQQEYHLSELEFYIRQIFDYARLIKQLDQSLED